MDHVQTAVLHFLPAIQMPSDLLDSYFRVPFFHYHYRYYNVVGEATIFTFYIIEGMNAACCNF